MSEDGNFITPVHYCQNKITQKACFIKTALFPFFCRQIPSKTDIGEAVLNN